MGKWNTPPLDIGTWYEEETSRYFKQMFGLPKGLLTLYTADDGYMHAYVPTKYFRQLHHRIEVINRKDYRALSRKLKAFYSLDEKAKKAVVKLYRRPKGLSNQQLARLIEQIRHWVHQVVIYDQFGWLGEEYWTPVLRRILEKKLKLHFGSKEYNEALFILTKPEKISTTLAEKRAVLEQAIRVKNKTSSLEKSAAKLTKQFGWLPVFTYGEIWDKQHYLVELKELLRKNKSYLKQEYVKLKNYTPTRNREVAKIVKKYKLNNKDLQAFIDFGLTIDTRNEAEYFVSFAGAFLMPLFKEARKRLYLSPKQLRELSEKELLAALRDSRAIEKILASKGPYGGWGYDEKMSRRIIFNPKEARELFKYIESYVKPVQGGDENRGTCASPGKVRGKIRIVPYPDQNYKVKDGDILVTYATTVDYLPAMKRAAAIITEVGGLTCHAAVVSREFGIPCIVALKNAMKNFKDGEKVEVLADKGIVRKISNV